MQACALATVNGEACARDFHAQVEVDEVIFLGQLPVRQGVLRQGGLHASGLYHHVVFGTCAFGYNVIGYVGYGAEQGVYLCLCVVHGLLQCLALFLQGCHLFLDFVGLGLLSLFHEGTNLSCLLLALRQYEVEL